MRPILLLLALLTLPVAAAAETARVPDSAAQITLSFAPIVREAAPAVVNIYASRTIADRQGAFADDPFFSQFLRLPRARSQAQNTLGSGVILSADGFVVTNHHVVDKASDIRVVLSDRREFAGAVVLDDAQADIAVIRLEGVSGLPALRLGDSDEIEVGDLALAIGNPFGVGQTVSSGIVSGLARSGANIGSRAGYYIQTDAPINPGNSGGALIDVKGRLIGINTSILTRSGGSNGIGFAIPANLVRQYLAQAQAGATEFQRPWAGVEVQPIDANLAEALGEALPRGLLLAELHPQSPFAAAGLQPGDVIETIDGRPVDAPEELDFRLAIQGPGGTATAQVRSPGDDTPRAVQIALAPAPDTPPADPMRITGRTPFDGLTVARANPALIDRLNLPLSAEGVVVVALDGYATRLGLRPGDMLLQLNGTPVDSPRTLERLVTRLDRRIQLQLLRDGRRMTLRFSF